MRINYFLMFVFLINSDDGDCKANMRQKRYLLFTQSTQWGVFATVSVPLHPESTTSVAWFFEANYYTVDNATYFQPLLGDIPWGRNHDKRSVDGKNDIFTRDELYSFIAAMLHKNGYPGRPCLLLAICEAANGDLTRSGVIGDLLHLILTPSTSIQEEDLDDCFYEAEYRGLEHDCEKYFHRCPRSPLDYISVLIENFA